MSSNRIFSILNARQHELAGMGHSAEGTFGAARSANVESDSPFVAIAMPVFVWPALTPVGALPWKQPTGGWQIQQQAFQRAFELARALLSPPRHERIMAASWN